MEGYPEEEQAQAAAAAQASGPTGQEMLSEFSFPETNLYIQQQQRAQVQRQAIQRQQQQQQQGRLRQLSQISGVEGQQGALQAHLLRQQQQQQHQRQQQQVSQPQVSQSYEAGASPIYDQGRRKRRRHHEEYHLDLQGLPQPEVAIELTPGGHHAQPQAVPLAYQNTLAQARQQQHHQHRHSIPAQSGSTAMQRPSYAEPGMPRSAGPGPPSLVGQEGMPQPAPKPRGPKLKFTPDDDQLLMELKEKRSLTWKQIAEFFPGRSSGTLQVRYCTKLKAKTTAWTDDTVCSWCLDFALCPFFLLFLFYACLPTHGGEIVCK